MANALIPDDFNDAHFAEIEIHLKNFLRDLQAAGTNARRVTSRLNYSNIEEIVPCWAGSTEDAAVLTLQRFDAGRVRFGRSNRSAVYTEAVKAPQGRIIERDWGRDLPEKSKVGFGPGDAVGPKSGCRHQLFKVIRIKHDGRLRCIGTVTSGYDSPPDRKLTDPVMERWATEGHPYVDWIKRTFQPGGPIT
jgi:hypothetical protein